VTRRARLNYVIGAGYVNIASGVRQGFKSRDARDQPAEAGTPNSGRRKMKQPLAGAAWIGQREGKT
jgi:hypothetical protein